MDKQDINQWLDSQYLNHPQADSKSVNFDKEFMLAMIEQCFTDLSPEWISVNDRLPETHHEYIVYDGSDIYECLLLNTKWNTLGIATHWMNKPRPPSEAKA